MSAKEIEVAMPYDIIGTYRNRSEVVDHAETKAEAEYLQAEYRMAFGPDWRIAIMHSDCDNRGGACCACREGRNP